MKPKLVKTRSTVAMAAHRSGGGIHANKGQRRARTRGDARRAAIRASA